MAGDAGRFEANVRVIALTLIILGALVLFSGCSTAYVSDVGRFAIISFDSSSSIAIVFDTATGEFEARNVPLIGDPRDPGFERQARADTNKEGMH